MPEPETPREDLIDRLLLRLGMQFQEQETPRVDLVCVFVLSVEWIVFGSAHFTMLKDTEAEIPNFITTQYKTLIAIVTGMIEVTTGMLILIPRMRKWAAMTSLILLCAFLPSVYHMLADEAAMRPFTEYLGGFARVILIPNNLFLALCAFHLLRQKKSATSVSQTLETLLSRPPEPTAKPARRKPKQRESISQVSTIIIAITMLLANAAGLFVVFQFLQMHYMTAALWAFACLATGALVGFLFGVPKVSLERAHITHRPNSNIEVVSDWLTKIIVGVGLVEFHNISTFLGNVSSELGRSLAIQTGAQSETEAASFAKALIVYFFVAGIIQGYLLTRMYLSRQFQEHEVTEVTVVEATPDSRTAQ